MAGDRQSINGVRRWTLVIRRDDQGVEHGWLNGPGVDPANVPPDLELVPTLAVESVRAVVDALNDKVQAQRHASPEARQACAIRARRRGRVPWLGRRRGLMACSIPGCIACGDRSLEPLLPPLPPELPKTCPVCGGEMAGEVCLNPDYHYLIGAGRVCV